MQPPTPELVEAIGKASEAQEFVERARGHLYSFHQLMGHADFLFGDAANMLREAGLEPEVVLGEEVPASLDGYAGQPPVPLALRLAR